MFKHQPPTLSILLTLLSVYLGMAAYITLHAPLDVVSFLYSEVGPYEVFSAGLWILLGILTLLSSALQPRTRIIGGIAALMMWARELDMHKSLFCVSFIKTNFYLNPDISLYNKVGGGLILLIITAVVVYLTVCMGTHLRHRHINNTRSLLLLSGLVLGIVSNDTRSLQLTNE